MKKKIYIGLTVVIWLTILNYKQAYAQPPYWKLGGNPNFGPDAVVVGNNFLGTALLNPVPINFGTNGATQMVLDLTGNVGIGVGAPGFRLQVMGDIDVIAPAPGNGYRIDGNTVLQIPFTNNPDGTRMAFITNAGNIDLYDFDRCTGLFSNYQSIEQSLMWSLIGIEFSAENNYMYVSNSDNNYNVITPNDTISDNPFRLYQYCLDSTNITATKTLIYTDSLLASRGFMQRAQNGKIYIATIVNPGFPYPDTLFTFYNQRLSVINDPGNPGTLCNFQPFSFYLGGARSYYGLPNNPNYELAAWDSSLCDTLGVGINVIDVAGYSISVYPNPASEEVTIHASFNFPLDYKIIDLSGRVIKTGNAANDGITQISIKQFDEGIYFIEFSFSNQVIASAKILVSK